MATSRPPEPTPRIATAAPALLFERVNAIVLVWFRVLLSLMLAYALWPRDLPLGVWTADWPVAARLYSEVFLSLPYRCCIYAALFWFAVGWRPRLAGAVLFCLLLPHVFLAKGRISRHVLVVALLLTTLLRTAPLWRVSQLKTLDAGPIWPIRLIQLQLTLLYAVNAIRKSTPEYLNGDVLMALSAARPNFLVDLTSGSMEIGMFAVPVWALATTTVAIEYWLAVGWWIPRCRWPTAAIGVAFHLFLKAFVIRIFMLDFAALFLYLTFLLPFGTSRATAAKS
jgi:hypothetical protein